MAGVAVLSFCGGRLHFVVQIDPLRVRRTSTRRLDQRYVLRVTGENTVVRARRCLLAREKKIGSAEVVLKIP